ncbi:MAG: preprotein translocase subunit YajC [Bacteroidales bacterium]|nr:preprotein translocase subunit YajC [Bacteroidales bacterium]
MMLLAISNGAKTGIMVVAMLVVFYFFLIRPQSQTAKKEQSYRDGLKVGDAVMTTGGIHGVITGVEKGYVYVQVAQGVKVRMSKTAIQPQVSNK